jgi:hypothetical protein
LLAVFGVETVIFLGVFVLAVEFLEVVGVTKRAFVDGGSESADPDSLAV